MESVPMMSRNGTRLHCMNGEVWKVPDTLSDALYVQMCESGMHRYRERLSHNRAHPVVCGDAQNALLVLEVKLCPMPIADMARMNAGAGAAPYEAVVRY